MPSQLAQALRIALDNGANLRYANLRYVNLYRADLSGANLYRANLSGANLCYAYLSGANLTNANLTNADLTNADLSGAYLSGVIGFDDWEVGSNGLARPRVKKITLADRLKAGEGFNFDDLAATLIAEGYATEFPGDKS